MRHVVRGGAVAAALFLVLTGCAPGGGTSENEVDPNREIQTDVSKMGELTLTVWDGQVQGAENEVMEQLNSAFMEKYPNVTIERVSRNFEDLRNTLRLAITDNEAPDIVQPNKGRSDMGAFIEADLLLPLDDYAEAYGWDTRFPSSFTDYSRWSEDATEWGSGNLYGVPQLAEVVGIYYNEAKLEANGLQPPETWSDFESQLAELKSAGEIPIQFGNLEQWPAIHEYGVIQSRFESVENIQALGFGNPGATYKSSGNIEAARILQDWAGQGYFAPGYNGQTYDDSARLYGEGEGVFFIAGTWLLNDFVAALGDDVGFMLPPEREGHPIVAPGGPDLPFSITSSSKHPDAAAAYIDFITNDDAMQLLASKGLLAINELDTASPSSDAEKDAHEALRVIAEADGMVPYLDYATPTMYDTIVTAFQDLLAQRITPEEFTDRVEADYAEFTDR